MFGFQANNTTREFEYPWAYYATELAPGMRVVDLGGSLCGFQFVLAKSGLNVFNVDPGMESHGRGWPVDHRSLDRLNRAFGTRVHLENCFLHQARIEPASVDRIFSISVIEHIPEAELPAIMQNIWTLLKPGGKFVATIDLFLNVSPFCSRTYNEFGTNVSVREMIESAPFALVSGELAELNGFPEFSTDRVLANLETFLIGRYPALVQTIVLQKSA